MASPPDRAPQGPPEPPGEKMSASSHIVSAGTAALSSFKPINKICQHICAFHCYAHDATRQVRAHHFCSHLSEEVRQCVLYDSDAPNARLLGIEYIISARLFEGLPEDEKKFWHSHQYEVTSGQLIAHNVPSIPENIDMAKVMHTYGKTWHTWQVDRGDALPLGPPQLMMSFTADGQLDPALLATRDKDWGTSTEDKRKARANLKADQPPSDKADQPWHTNRGIQVEARELSAPFRPADMPGPEQFGGVRGV